MLLIVLALGELRGDTRAHEHALAVGVIPFGLVLATALAVFTGDASVDASAAGVGVELDTTLWPAWAGLTLAVVVAAAAFAPVVADLRGPQRRGALPAAPA